MSHFDAGSIHYPDYQWVIAAAIPAFLRPSFFESSPPRRFFATMMPSGEIRKFAGMERDAIERCWQSILRLVCVDAQTLIHGHVVVRRWTFSHTASGPLSSDTP